jgi:hypothetical protein
MRPDFPPIIEAMKVQKALMAFIVCGAIALPAAAGTTPKVGDGVNVQPLYPLDIALYASGWRSDDRNGDGLLDHAVQYDKNGNRSAEAYDINFDGKMDDFYSFENGAIVLEQVDSNFDGLVDIWVHIYQGVYVSGYERDSDYDGKLDKVKTYGRDQIVKR